MGRRTKTSPAEDFMDLVARLPWWVCVLLAVISYVLLSALAARPLMVPTNPAQIAGLMIQTVVHAAALVGQFVVPILCLAGAALSAWRRDSRRALFDGAASGQVVQAVDAMSWQQFEQLVGEAFRRQGFGVRETGQGGADGGVDLVLARNGETFLVQAKRWRAQRVGVEVVRELYGVMAAKGAAGGFVVTSGRFTDEAQAFAQGRNVELVDGAVLRTWIEGSRTKPATQNDRPGPATHPACPQCGRAMVRRTAKRGPNTGRDFWGCSGYPGCRGTASIN